MFLQAQLTECLEGSLWRRGLHATWLVVAVVVVIAVVLWVTVTTATWHDCLCCYKDQTALVSAQTLQAHSFYAILIRCVYGIKQKCPPPPLHNSITSMILLDHIFKLFHFIIFASLTTHTSLSPCLSLSLSHLSPLPPFPQFSVSSLTAHTPLPQSYCLSHSLSLSLSLFLLCHASIYFILSSLTIHTPLCHSVSLSPSLSLSLVLLPCHPSHNSISLLVNHTSLFRSHLSPLPPFPQFNRFLSYLTTHTSLSLSLTIAVTLSLPPSSCFFLRHGWSTHHEKPERAVDSNERQT